MNKKSDSNFFQSSDRSLAQNSLQTKQKFRRKTQGNSEFVKSKFDIDYDPKYRVIKQMEIYNNRGLSKQSTKNQQLSKLVYQTQEQLKKGKKIVIDWSQQNNFRSTKFPSLDEKYTNFRRANTQQIYISKLETPKKAKYYDYLQKFQSNPALKQIATKGQYLRQIVSQNIAGKRKKAKIALNCKRLASQFTMNSPEKEQRNLHASSFTNIEDSHTIMQEIQQRKKEFFQKNNTKIEKAIKFQRHLEQTSIHQQKKNKIQMIQDRILCKSKLTLLKCDLAKKFKEIQDSVLDDGFSKNHIDLK